MECQTEYRTAETLNKQILCARLEPDTGIRTADWQWCDLFGDGPQTGIDIGDGDPVRFATRGLYRLRDAIRGAGIGAEAFVWPVDEPDRAPYRGWEPFDPVDAGVFFGRDAQIVRALDALRGMRIAQTKRWLVVLGPSGTGKSSFLRAGLMPRLQRDDRQFLVLGWCARARRADRRHGLATAIAAPFRDRHLTGPPLGEIKTACLRPPARCVTSCCSCATRPWAAAGPRPGRAGADAGAAAGSSRGAVDRRSRRGTPSSSWRCCVTLSAARRRRPGMHGGRHHPHRPL